MEQIQTNKLAYTVPEMAQALGIGRNAAYGLTKISGFPVITIGRSVRIPIHRLQQWLDQQAEGV